MYKLVSLYPKVNLQQGGGQKTHTLISANLCYILCPESQYRVLTQSFYHTYYLPFAKLGRHQNKVHFAKTHFRQTGWQNLAQQNSVCSGLKFSSESKLFGGCHLCSRATSATLNSANTTQLPGSRLRLTEVISLHPNQHKM